MSKIEIENLSIVKGQMLDQCGFRFTIKPESYCSKCVVVLSVESYPPIGEKGSVGPT